MTIGDRELASITNNHDLSYRGAKQFVGKRRLGTFISSLPPAKVDNNVIIIYLALSGSSGYSAVEELRMFRRKSRHLIHVLIIPCLFTTERHKELHKALDEVMTFLGGHLSFIIWHK